VTTPTVTRLREWALPVPRGVLLDAALAVLCIAMLALMTADPGEETIPYHILFLALTITYGFRVWRLTPTLVVISLVTASTGWIMYAHFLIGAIDEPELAEIPLMPALFVAMVWHARRRAAAQQQVQMMADERRARLEREREFFRDTSHAIRTPLTIARGHLDLAARETHLPSVRDDVETALRQLERMSRLSNHLLRLAQLDAGVLLRHEPIRIQAWIREAGESWARSTDRDWSVSCPADTTVLADPEWLALAVDALIENAVRFTKEGGRIELSASVEGARCTIRVVDSGPGITPEDIDHVFERFWHRLPPNGQMGSGLGLPMALATAQACGGTVVARNHPRGGAVFEMRLPAQLS
jgi:signal transduction histidine kinase